MMTTKKRKPAAGPGAGSQDSSIGSGNRRTGRPEFQGKGNARHAGQRPPHWRKPTGADGMAMLEALFGPPAVPFNRRGRELRIPTKLNSNSDDVDRVGKRGA